MSNTTISMSNGTILTTTQAPSLFNIRSSLIGLVWFETVGAFIAYGLGFIGNLLSLIIFSTQGEFRKISTGLLFLFISISNFFHLWTLATEFLTIYNIAVFQNGFLQCQLTYFIQNLSRAMSTYFMVTIAIDRLIRSEIPMRSKQICRKENVIKITCIYLIIFSLFWSFYFYPYISQNPITGSCSSNQPTAAFTFFLSKIYLPVRAVIVCFIPAIIMLLANIRMLINIRRSRTRIADGITMNSTETHTRLPDRPNFQVKKNPRRMTALDRMLFYMMLANVGVFLTTQIPFHIYSCISNKLSGLNPFTGSLIRAMLLIWSSLYFGLAFYFYCLASPLFRHKFIKIIKKIFCCQAIHRSRAEIPTLIG